MSKCGQDIEISIQVLDENTKRYAETFKCSNEILITISIKRLWMIPHQLHIFI